jgi:hypothetical protein
LELASFARLVEGYQDSTGQLSLWRLYSFRDLPVELISNIYQLFVKDASSSIYTPPALVRLMLEEALSWERLDKLMAGDGDHLDPLAARGFPRRGLSAARSALALAKWLARPIIDELKRSCSVSAASILKRARWNSPHLVVCLSL